jgi:hypothetical protein
MELRLEVGGGMVTADLTGECRTIWTPISKVAWVS